LLDGNFVSRSAGPLPPSTMVDLFGIEGARLLLEGGGDGPIRRKAQDDDFEPESGISLILFETSETGEESRQ
jgi:hypothetical protein